MQKDIKLFMYMQYPSKMPFKTILRPLMGNLLKGNFVEIKKNLKRYEQSTMYHKEINELNKSNKGPLFGLDMYREMASAAITINIHIDCANNNSGNMRLFEATGMGVCVVTENSENISSLFTLEKEVITCQGEADIIERVIGLKNNISMAHQIGKDAQNKTLSVYTIRSMFESISEVF
jgi:spore maturation protein CgeB